MPHTELELSPLEAWYHLKNVVGQDSAVSAPTVSSSVAAPVITAFSGRAAALSRVSGNQSVTIVGATPRAVDAASAAVVSSCR